MVLGKKNVSGPYKMMYGTLGILLSLMMIIGGPVASLSHVDTTYQDFFDDGDAGRFQSSVVSGGSVRLKTINESWTQTNWELGPGHSVWADQDGYHGGDAIEHNTSGQISLWPRYGTWQRVSNMSNDLRGHDLVWAGDRFIMTGGLGSSGMSELTYAYYVETDTWQKRANSPIKLYDHASAWNDHYVYVMGDIGLMDSMLMYDTDLNIWTNLGNAPIKRNGHSMVAIDEETLLIFGGKNESGVAVDELWTYNVSTDTWVQLRSAPKSMYGHSAVWDNSSDLMIISGGKNSGGYLWDTYSYDPKDDLWNEIQHLPSSRVDHTMVWSADDDRSIMFGGEGGGYLKDVFIYDQGNDDWVNGVLEPSGRAGHAAAWGSGAMVVVGGQNEAGYLNETWVYRYSENRTDGWMTSSEVDIGHNVNFIDFDFEYNIPSDTRIEVQFASNTDHQTWDFLGPDGTPSTKYDIENDWTIPDVHDGDRYFKYKVFLLSTDVNLTPDLFSISINFKSYENPGSFISRVFDLFTDGVVIDSFRWNASLPSGTDIKMSLTSSPNADMSAPTIYNRSVGNGVMVTDNISRYISYEAKLITLDRFYTPVLEAVHIDFSSEPGLSKGVVKPDSGIMNTTFTYLVEYIDLEGRPPTLSQVVIDGTAYDVQTSDSDMTDGAMFTYLTTLPVGDHDYYFNFRVADINLRLPQTGTLKGPKVVATNQRPVAIITLPTEDRTFEVGENIVLKGDKSYDPDGDNLTYSWSSSLTGLLSNVQNDNVTLSMGEHLIILTVADPQGEWGRAFVNITVLVSGSNDIPKVVVTAGDFTKKVGEGVKVDASHSYDPDGSIVKWTFDWGDGTNVTTQTDGMATHVFDTEGTYFVTVTVEDNNGGTDQTTFSVIIKPEDGPKEPKPPDYTTSVGGQLSLLIPIIVILVGIALVLIMARRSKS